MIDQLVYLDIDSTEEYKYRYTDASDLIWYDASTLEFKTRPGVSQKDVEERDKKLVSKLFKKKK